MDNPKKSERMFALLEQKFHTFSFVDDILRIFAYIIYI